MRSALMIAALLAAIPLAAGAASCPERPACRGCGCKGGTGYRGPDGRCVGFRQLDGVCGPAPHGKCTFENAPGTGENRDCALAPRRPKRDTGTSPST